MIVSGSLFLIITTHPAAGQSLPAAALRQSDPVDPEVFCLVDNAPGQG
jgi:hypothetical protein